MIALLALLGLAVGAALPRVIAQIPDREPAEGEPRPASYRELAAMTGLPVVLAAGTAGAWSLLAVARADLGGALGAFLLVAALGAAMVYIDIREHRLPDWLTIPAFAGAAVALGVAAAAGGDWSAYGRAWAAAAVSLVVFLLLAVLRPSDLGLGDVKLAAVIGLVLGWISWPVVVFGIFGAFVIGAVAGLALLVAGRAGRRTAIPFGPAMLLAALIAAVWGQSITDAYLGL
ncbi:prepilin peptidase [Phytoactinopolyspora endophytica]|uniref:prepilin peptidase n=1 Tax=Phytoactinopolyspora endophytica TaxID=1642495 RepID=UPI00101D5491|nr:A24 family peptidase [Phytoactinopolyspora endophytica]